MRKLKTVFIIFFNWGPIMWFSKKKNLIEMYTFWSEFTYIRVGIEMVIGLSYILINMDF